MIGYLKGKVLSFSEGVVLLENNGIGYEVFCSASAFKMLTENKSGEIFTYLAVREDDISLFGFISQEEKNMFLKLITVSGVGPKMGITILSGMTPDDLALKIATNDVKGLSKVKGLGKKTAERIILELREKIGTVDTETGEVVTAVEIDKEEENQDAVIALMSLGFTKIECVKALEGAKQSGAKTIQDFITYALKNIR